MKDVALVNVYFGKAPHWIHFFIKSCSNNPKYSWILFTDMDITSRVDNVIIIPFTLKEFNELASEKLNMPINVSCPYKLCDYKPAYGRVFEDYLSEYHYWGYCDIDLVFGDLDSFLEPSLGKFDIITTENEYLAGHFTLYRNNNHTKQLFNRIHNIKKCLIDSKRLYYLDEIGNYIGSPFADQYGMLFLETKNIFRRFVNSVKYRWHKQMNYACDISKVVQKEIVRGNLEISVIPKALSDDLSVQVEMDKDWNIQWQGKRLFYKLKEIMYFHFLKTKPEVRFAYKKGSNEINITPLI